MKVTNIRLGFATNSSSSHSVILGGGPRSHGDIAYAGDLEYGWDYFTLNDAGEKASYLAVAVWDSIPGPEWQKMAVMEEIFRGTPIPNAFRSMTERSSWSHPYIDHQSAFTLPGVDSPNFPSLVKEALEFFTDSRLSIYGGNDNDSQEIPGNMVFGDYGRVRIRRDGDNYTIFNWDAGAKVRLANGEWEKSEKPELVDLKITNRCPYRCSFCYQGSIPDGDEPDLWKITPYIEAIGINGVGAFEVAIGGGEPTSHPDFAAIIHACLDNFVKPNFTTFAVDWLLDKKKVEAARLCGGIGVSVHSKRDLDKVRKISSQTGSFNVVAQHVYGTLSVKDTLDLLSSAEGMHILLLGYKTTGFGASQKPHDMEGLPQQIRSCSIPKNTRLSVDTAMVNLHPDLLEKLKAEKIMYTAREGAFSMYLDAASGCMGMSSYDPDSMVAITGEKPSCGQITAMIMENYPKW